MSEPYPTFPYPSGNHLPEARATVPAEPSRPAEHVMACCTSAIGPVCRHRTTPVADALQEVNRIQGLRPADLPVSYIVSAELHALRELADAVRSHGIGADLAAKRGD